MDMDKKVDLLSDYLIPLIPGTTVSEIQTRTQQSKIASKLPGGRKIAVTVSDEDPKQVVLLKRDQKFTQLEHKVIEEFINLVNIYTNIDDKYIDFSISSNMSYVISKSVIKKESDFDNVNEIINSFEEWAAETYEGSSISAAIMYYPKKRNTGIIKLSNFIEHDFSKVLSNGFDTYICVNKKGEVFSYEASGDYEPNNYKVPFRYTSLSEHAKKDNVLFILNRNGEILIVQDKELLFAKRRGNWKVFNHDTSIQQMAFSGKNLSEDFRKQVYATCLDVSFARTGACIGLLYKTHQDNAMEKLLRDDDSIQNPGNPKSEFLSIFKNETFLTIDRIFRQEFASIDGATVLDREGKVISIGAILTIEIENEKGNNQSETGGGRTAAARQLSDYGVGIKVSEDGEISIFKEGERRFSIA